MKYLVLWVEVEFWDIWVLLEFGLYLLVYSWYIEKFGYSGGRKGRKNLLNAVMVNAELAR